MKIPFPPENQVNFLIGKYNKDELLEIIDKYSLESHHLNLIGNAFRAINEFDLAEHAFFKSIELMPEYDEPYGNLISLYIIQEKYDQCEDVYLKGMKSATKKSFIIFQDGRLAFIKRNFDQSLMAARTVLMDENMDYEPAFILAIHSLLSLIKEGKGENIKNYCSEASETWQTGINKFPQSDDLKQLSKYFIDED